MPASVQPPVLPLGKKLFFAAILVVGLPLIAEGGARLLHGWNRHWLDCHRPHPTLGWTLRENWAGKWNWVGGYSRINAQGLRDDDDLPEKADGDRRILCVGDSVTFGAKVLTEEAFPEQLQRRLASRGHSLRVLNGGVSSYDPSQEADWLEVFGWGHAPDLVILQFCRNDLDASPRRRHPLAQAGAAGTWLTEHSLLAHKFQRTLARLAAASKPAPSPNPQPKQERGGWPLVENAYRQIAQSARERKVPVVLVIFPHLDHLTEKDGDDLSSRLAELAAELAWPVLDLDRAYRNASPARLYLPEDPIHPNAAGYALAADAIAEFLVTRALLP